MARKLLLWQCLQRAERAGQGQQLPTLLAEWSVGLSIGSYRQLRLSLSVVAASGERSIHLSII